MLKLIWTHFWGGAIVEATFELWLCLKRMCMDLPDWKRLKRERWDVKSQGWWYYTRAPIHKNLERALDILWRDPISLYCRCNGHRLERRCALPNLPKWSKWLSMKYSCQSTLPLSEKEMSWHLEFLEHTIPHLIPLCLYACLQVF